MLIVVRISRVGHNFIAETEWFTLLQVLRAGSFAHCTKGLVKLTQCLEQPVVLVSLNEDVVGVFKR